MLRRVKHVEPREGDLFACAGQRWWQSERLAPHQAVNCESRSLRLRRNRLGLLRNVRAWRRGAVELAANVGRNHRGSRVIVFCFR